MLLLAPTAPRRSPPDLGSTTPSLSPDPRPVGTRPSAGTAAHPLLAMMLSEGCLVIPDLVLMEGPVAILGRVLVSYFVSLACYVGLSRGRVGR